MAQLDVLLVLPFIFGLIPVLIFHYFFVLNLIIPCYLGVKKMRCKKQLFTKNTKINNN